MKPDKYYNRSSHPALLGLQNGKIDMRAVTKPAAQRNAIEDKTKLLVEFDDTVFAASSDVTLLGRSKSYKVGKKINDA